MSERVPLAEMAKHLEAGLWVRVGTDLWTVSAAGKRLIERYKAAAERGARAWEPEEVEE